jgi:hypothetical protein
MTASPVIGLVIGLVDDGLQELLVYGVVAAALGWQLLRWRRGRTRKCSSCSSAPRSSDRGVRPRGLTILP